MGKRKYLGAGIMNNIYLLTSNVQIYFIIHLVLYK